MKRIASILRISIALAVLCAPSLVAAQGFYPASNIGFDVSYSTFVYPATSFSFAIVGVTHGKAFTYNDRLTSEYAWARFGATVAPTIYMNLNAPYGSKVAGHTSTPKTCPSTLATSTEPTACEGYNFGYNAAKDAFAYAKSRGIASTLWWLDIEEANSWSEDVTVNDATIQGAIDYLNFEHIRVGIYSMKYMWKNIAGTSFAPVQKIGIETVTTPLWVPIGITTLVGAINACHTSKTDFMASAVVWLVQYVADETAIDQNVAC